MGRWKSILVALALLAPICFYGCAQGKEDPAHGPEVIAPARFAKTAKAICARANVERGKAEGAFLERRTEETGESLGLAGTFEMVQQVVAPSLSREIDRLERIGLPKGHVYEGEALWQTLRIVQSEVEAEGLYAWRSAKLLRPFRNRARAFGLDTCVVN